MQLKKIYRLNFPRVKIRGALYTFYRQICLFLKFIVTNKDKLMKIKDGYPNYKPALMFYIGDKNFVLASDDSKIYSYFIPLHNFKKGFDYYELTSHKNGGVYFSVVTMLGFKTLLRTDSQIIHNDLQELEWNKLIGDMANTHFLREEYQALKKGYVKKGGGCMSTVLFGITFLVIGLVSFLTLI